MNHIAKLKRTVAEEASHGIDSSTNQKINDAVAKLAKRYKRVEDLWEQIGSDFLAGVKRLAQANGIEQSILVQILARAAREPEPEAGGKAHKFRFWLAEHGIEGLTFVVILTLIGLLLARALSSHDTVVLNSSLPAYHVIEESDLAIAKKVKTPGSFASKNEVVGRYLLQPVQRGAVLFPRQISASSLPEGDRAEVPRRQILSLPVKSGAISSNLAPMTHVRLLFSPRDRGEQIAAPLALENFSVDDVMILAINRQGDASSLVVALKTMDDVAKVISLAGIADVFVSESTAK